jgi:outer membrane protein TolC
MNTELTNAKQRVASAHERLGLQRVRFRTLRAGGRDTNRAEAVFRTMRQTMEASEEDRFQIEAELVMARAGAWS